MHEGMSRRQLFSTAAAPAALPLVNAGVPVGLESKRILRVQPVLTYEIPKRREGASWRQWGGLQTEADLNEEKARIGRDLAVIKAKGPASMEFLPLREAATVEQAKEVAQLDYDAAIIYGAGGNNRILEAVTRPDRWNMIFIRHRSGPVYLWYEIVHPRYLRKTVDQYGQPGVTVEDIVIDEPGEIAWRLSALAGLKNTLGRRVLCIGGASGWGAGGRKAPQIARDLWKLDLVEFSIPQLGERMKTAYADSKMMREAQLAAGKYLSSKQVKLEVPKESVERAFVLTHVFRELMKETGSTAMTVNQCMGAIMGASQTTACLPLSVLNDEGYLAFCESDFVVIPSGILLNGIAGVPVFLNDPTYPHHGLVTIAHCTAPRRLDGKTDAPVRVLTHFESDFGASPEVEMRMGEKVTNIVPDFDAKKWVGFLGEVVGNPFMPICRSQVDIGLNCSDQRLAGEMRGFHWMTSYTDALKETGYAVKKLGIEWLDLTAKG
jgi:hypothetical protein